MESLLRIVVVAFLASSAISSGSDDLDKALEYVWCNDETYKAGIYADNVAHVLEEMTTVTANSPDYNYGTRTTSLTDIVYSRSKCNSTLAVSDCVHCMGAAKATINKNCPVSVGGQVHLMDCSMKYEPYQL